MVRRAGSADLLLHGGRVPNCEARFTEERARSHHVPRVRARHPGDEPHCGRRSYRQCVLDFALRPRGLNAYTASKGAVIALTKAIAADHGADGIRANCVALGPVYAPMVYARGMTEQARDTRRQASVLKREGTGWDICDAVRLLLSDQARCITSRVLVVDGGATLFGPSRASQ